MALAGELFRIDTTVIMPAFVSQVKQQAARSYGAKVILTETRPQAEALAASYAQAGAFFLHPSDHDSVIAGQGTLCLEALQDDAKPDAIFAACGGGGLLAGTLLAAQLAAPDACVYGCEPLQANDAARSVRQGSITGFDNTPPTIADGARTLRITPRTFSYLERLSGFYEIPERDIIYWTQWLQHLLKITIEPTAALAMAGAFAWLRGQTDKQCALVLISGGNVDAMTYERIWATSFLEQTPQL